METEKKKKKKKGAYGKVLGFCVLASCAALVLAFFGGDGFGFGGGSGFGLGGPGGNGNGTANGTSGSGYSQGEYVPGDNYEDDNNQENGSDGVINDEPVNLTIRVSGNNIYHDQDEVTSYELIRLFEEVNQPGLIWELVDDQAIHETLVTVRALMNENGVDFVER
ncbi:MAG: hypothetical protein FWE42_03565 [Defluviitaleaceae bacterium]|nr:hypothetical protein [Defluviitaleaceae bacterium]